MAGIDFDRQVFVPSNSPQGKPVVQLVVPLVVVAALALIGFVGYKAFLVNAQNNETAAANAQVQELQQQVVEMQKRIDTLEKHRKGAETSPAPLPGFTAAMNLKSMTRKSYRPRVPWLLLNRRSALLVSELTGFVCEEAMKIAARENPNRWATRLATEHMVRKVRTDPAYTSGLRSRKTPAVGVVFFLDFSLRELKPGPAEAEARK
jgi:hypothetical protein